MKYERADSWFEGAAKAQPLTTKNILGFNLADSTADQAITAILASRRCKVAFMNAHCANMARQSEDYAHALHRADFILPDGIGIELAGKLAAQDLTANLNGTDFVPQLMQQAAEQGKRVFLLGGRPGTAEAAAQQITKATPGLHIVGTRDGFGGLEAAVRDINASGADILLVGMGVPLQDLWIDQHFDQLDVQVALGVGALLDFWAGNVTRAPKIMRRARMEWVWRLMMEPRRLAKRYLLGNFTFLCAAMLWNLRQITGADVLKRGIDFSLSFMALMALSPLLALTALAISIESKGAPLFKQTRIGRNGRKFTMYKFRSMYQDAEKRRAALLKDSDRSGVCFKSKSDPRVTRIGALLRRYSIDELPQIFNVLRGDMSIVGPRPGLPVEVKAYSDLAQGRLQAKPGLTGLWQVSGRADIGFEQMITMDLAYIRSRSLMLDALIIGLTLRAVVSGRGAY